MRSQDRGCASDDTLVVLVEHPRVNGEGFTKQDAVAVPVAKLQGAIVSDRRDRDQVTKAGQRPNFTKFLWRVRAQQMHGWFKLLTKIVCEPAEKPTEHRLRTLQGGDARIVGRCERGDVALNSVKELDVRENEYGNPFSRHVAILQKMLLPESAQDGWSEAMPINCILWR